MKFDETLILCLCLISPTVVSPWLPWMCVRLPGDMLYTVNMIVHRGWVQFLGFLCVGVLVSSYCVYLRHPFHLVYVNNANRFDRYDGVLNLFFRELSEICCS